MQTPWFFSQWYVLVLTLRLAVYRLFGKTRENLVKTHLHPQKSALNYRTPMVSTDAEECGKTVSLVIKYSKFQVIQAVFDNTQRIPEMCNIFKGQGEIFKLPIWPLFIVQKMGRMQGLQLLMNYDISGNLHLWRGLKSQSWQQRSSNRNGL